MASRPRATRGRFLPLPLLIIGSGLLVGSCTSEEEAVRTTFYSRRIAPILEGSCANSPAGSGCHVRADGKGNALGNLSVESFADVNKRRDLFVDYGPYGVPAMLLRVLPPYQLRLTAWNGETQAITTDVAHAGGSMLDFSSSGFLQLDRWIENGATENNAPGKARTFTRGQCAERLGEDPLFDASLEPTGDDYAVFKERVNGTLGESCAAGNCHGNPGNQLYLTCGETEEQARWNYFAASDYVSQDAPASEILRRTLAPAAGGTYHEGGAIFPGPDDGRYQGMLTWAEQKGGPDNLPEAPGFSIFATRVQPMLVKRGCMQLGCHSASMFHDYRLRGGSGGHFSLPATRQNYDLTLDMVALESPRVNTSRLLRKNLAPTGRAGSGIIHRGGPLFGERTPGDCDLEAALTGPLDEQSPYCVIAAWIQEERADRMRDARPLSALVYVKRETLPEAGTFQDYAVYAPGSDVLLRVAALAEDGGLVLEEEETSLLAECGLDPQSTDARRPAVAWDGQRIAFAARSAADEGFRIFVRESDGSCTVEGTIDAAPVDEDGEAIPDNGELIHNFDPAFAPDGRLVFASTRGNVMNTQAFSYQGPQRTPADPSRLNANLYIVDAPGEVRQLTFLLNQERQPAFKADGRVIFVTEKRAPGFYQLAARRQNLDGGDYHPLFGQRPSIGHNQLTEPVELADRNFAFILSERGAAHGAGALAILNRTIGVDQRSQDPDDFPADPGAIDWLNPDFYQRSLTFPDARATGELDGTEGAYRNPTPLPDGRVLVSYDGSVTDLGSFPGSFDLAVVDPLSRRRQLLLEDVANLLWPVAVYARPQRGVFTSRLTEANGAVEMFTDAERRRNSDITVLDAPVLLSLLFQNTRTGRPLPSSSDPGLGVWESLPPEAGVTSYEAGGRYVTEDEFGKLYVRRRRLGSANIFDDGSARFRIAGGMPIVLSSRLQLAGDDAPTEHFQREEMQFYPGEWTRQSFPRSLFNGICAGCHGSVSGQELDIAVNPDILTRASDVVARDAAPDMMDGGGGEVRGPPFP